MKSLTLLLTLGLASSEKLDRTYLPPPGSKFAGGRPGDIQVPLEFPKETYSTTLRPITPGHVPDGLSPEDSRLTVGTDRGIGVPNIAVGSLGSVTPRPQGPIAFFQDPYKLPSTTTSYAFTQTTTFPSEGFETTVNPSSYFQQQNIGHTFPQAPQDQQINNQVHPGYSHSVASSHNIGFTPTLEPSIQGSGFGSQSPIAGGQTFVDGHEGQAHPQDLNQYQQALPPTSTNLPTTSNIQPGLLPQSPGQNQGLTNYLGVQPPRQLIGQQSTFHVHPSLGSSQDYQPGILQYGDTSNNIQETLKHVSNIPEQLGGQRPLHFGSPQGNIPSIPSQGVLATYLPGTPQYGTDTVNFQDNVAPGPNHPQQFGGQQPILPGQQGSLPSTGFPQGIPSGFQQPGNSQFGNIMGTLTPGSSGPQQLGDKRPPQRFDQQGVLPSTISPQRRPSSYQQSSKYGSDLTTTSVPNISQTSSFPGQQIQTVQPVTDTQILNDNRFRNQYPNLKPGDSGVSDGSFQNIYRSDSTATSSILPPGYSNQPSFPSTTPTIFPSLGTTADKVYSPATPGISNQANIVPIRPNPRSERPQAEFDRNAVILNYENVLTPEGYAYSFDTSNGIHADESAMVTDGVKAMGSYSYTGDDGKLYNVVYTADENGFQPRGDHLPTPPPIPEAIQRVIEQAAMDKEAGISHDGFYDEDKYGHEKYQGPKNFHRPNKQDRIVINGADIPDEDQAKIQETEHKKSGPHGGRRPVTTTEQIPREYGPDFMQNENQVRGGQTVERKTMRPTGRVPPHSRPYNNIPEQEVYEGNYNKDGNVQKVPSRQPTISTKTDSIRHHPMTTGRKPVRPGSSISEYIGSQNDNKEEILDETDDFGMKSNIHKTNRPLPPNRQPTKTTSTKYVEYDLQDSLGGSNLNQPPATGRPHKSKRPTRPDMRYIERNDDIRSQGYDKDESPQQPHRLPTSTSSTTYVESEHYSDDEQLKPGVSDVMQQKKSLKPTVTNRPNSSSSSFSDTKNGKPRLHGASVTQRYDDHQEDSYDKKDRQPTFDQQNGVVSNNYENQKPSDSDSGYQYIAPRNKFNQGETTQFPLRFNEVTSTKTPSEMSDGQTTIRPFMTPNVSRDDDSDESNDDDVNQTFPPRKQSKSSSKVTLMPVTTLNDYEDENGSEYIASEVEPDQEIDNENDTSTNNAPKHNDPTGKPGTSPLSSTRRPANDQSRQTSARPQYDEEHSPDNHNRIDQKRPVPPGQTHIKQYPVERTDGRPGQETYYGESTKITKTPTDNIVLSTTPIPGSSYTQSRYPTTYENIDVSKTTIDNSDETMSPRFVTMRPGTSSRVPHRPTFRPGYSDRTSVPTYSTSRPEISQAHYDRTTLRPVTNYSQSTTVQGPAPIRAGFTRIPPGRQSSEPITDFDDSTVAQKQTTLRPGSSRFPSTTFRPSTIADYDRTLSPDYTTTKPGSIFSGRPGIQIQNLPSTTYRPNYIFTDNNISPKSGGQSRPGIKVDRYGRPISEPGREVTGSTTYRPEYSITSTQDSRIPSVGLTDFQTPEKVFQTFKSNEPRFGKPEYGYPQGSDIGQEPNRGSVQYPGNDIGRPSTERIFGEDFSGPKQPQRFDPQTGYHY